MGEYMDYLEADSALKTLRRVALTLDDEGKKEARAAIRAITKQIDRLLRELAQAKTTATHNSYSPWV